MIGGDGSGTFTVEPLTKNTDELYESYSKGREDAWEAARKIIALSDDDRIRYFCTGYVLEEYSPKEAIEKLRQYEKEVESFEIGDKVESALGRWVVLGEDGDMLWGIDPEGSGHRDEKRYLKKTGRTFPEVPQLLKKIGGSL